MEYRINGENMHTRQDAHEEIARVMAFPEFYGKNLDALWDMLTTTKGEVVIENITGMLNALGSYGCRLLKTFYDAAEENARLDVKVQ